MKKCVYLLLIIFLFITGCSNHQKNTRIIDKKLYNFSIFDWKKSSSSEHDKIVDKIIKIWESNNEEYPVNFAVDRKSIMTRIEEYIDKTSDYSQSIFKIACGFVFVDYSLYKIS